MNESAARDVLLVRAVERADVARAILTDKDREHAARAAAELTRWDAAERGRPAAAEEFVARRAQLLAGKLAEREPVLARAIRALEWRPWIGTLLPAIAFAVGAVLQHVSDRQHINVLAFPLLSIVLWNVAVYALLLIRAIANFGRPAVSASGLKRAVLRLAGRVPTRIKGRAADAFAAFVGDWTSASAPVLEARAARVLHMTAALLALGALTGMYVRGLVFEYRAGWESTFLDAAQVHALLSVLLAPAAHALGMPFPSVEHLAAIRWPQNAGENAARWIHWYALAVSAVVIVPRLLLAAFARWRERRLTDRFPVALDEPYFRRMLGGFAQEAVRLRVVPYSYTTDEASARGLSEVAKALLGERGELVARPSVPFGAEQSATDGLDAADRSIALTAALFSLAATPEHENHGAFLEALRAAVGDRLVALVDEAPYRRRLGSDAIARMTERRAAWFAFGAALRVPVVFVDLAGPDLQQLERDVEPVLALAR